QPPDTTLDAGHVDLDVTADSTLPVTVTTDTPAVCTVTGAVVTVVGVGACTVTAAQPGNDWWAPAGPLVRTFHVLPNEQTIVVVVPPAIAADADTIPLHAVASSGLPVTWTSVTSDTCT